MIRYLLILTGLFLVASAFGQDVIDEQPSFTPEQIEFFESQIRPVLVQHCYGCHSTDAPEIKAGLYVDSRQGLLHGGDSGAAIVEGKPSGSLLIESVNFKSNEMPPDGKLKQQQIDALTQWVEMGAPWPPVTSSAGVPAATSKTDWATFDFEAAQRSHWAWQRVERPEIPVVDEAFVFNPIDNFVAARRIVAGLSPASVAATHILVRRIYNDLIGIPPTPPQVQSFTNAATVDHQRAVESLVDELLQSPMYGQRWGRHWLDVARYSDGRGGFMDSKALQYAWRYRDWVVEAFNGDMPIDEFIRLQIAGDLTGEGAKAIATGFFALGPTYKSDGGDPDSVAQAKGETLDDRIDTLTRGLLGITGSCARCHDHKFDPIPQQDYYSLAGIFNNTAIHDRPLVPEEVVKRFNEYTNSVNALNKQINPLRKKLNQEKREATLDEQENLDQWTAQLTELTKDAPSNFDVAHTLRESGSRDMKVALRGNLRKTGEVAPRRFPRILSGRESNHFTQGSGREELAAAIVDPRNPLTARVFVNRIWLHHFGAGLVRTPSNFGTLGQRPTHPQLLDWLTSEFVSNGWSLKSLHRLIMTSATYQLGSTFDEQAFKADGDNRWLWRMSPRRMDVEAWRDSMLSVTGELDPALGGPPFDDLTNNNRRTLYAKVSRNGDVFSSDTFLRRFDFPLMRATVAQRPNSIVPQQFLFLLNSKFMIQRSKALVARLKTESDSDENRINQVYLWLFNRSPEPAELQLGLAFVTGASDQEGLSRWDQYAQVLLSSNEFMFVR